MLQNDTVQLSHISLTTSVTSLITACAIFHVVCTWTFFGDTICFLTNRKIVKIVTRIDLHIVLTHDWWHWFLAGFLVFNIWVSHALEMTINFIYPTFYSLKSQNFVYPTLFSSVPPINNDRSLNSLAVVSSLWVFSSLCCFHRNTPIVYVFLFHRNI
jgi:hypothetical protein